MTGQESGSDRTPHDGHDAAHVPDEVWLKFLTDDESAIRRSAPREPSAVERTVLARRDQPDADGAGAAVGELWEPEDRWGGPSWRDMDSRARRRRVGRAVGTLAAVALLFGALSLLPANSSGPYRNPGGIVSQPTEETAEDLPATTATTVPKAVFAPDGG